MAMINGDSVYLVSAFVDGLGTTLLGFRQPEAGVQVDFIPRDVLDLNTKIMNKTQIYVDYMFSQIPVDNRGNIAWAERGAIELRLGGCWMTASRIIYFDDALISQNVQAIEKTISQVEQGRTQRRSNLVVPESQLVIAGS
jgi:hypothetical protein